MSLSALPEWKQLLLERKRKEEEERERREREEEERLASMPAWKRGIIQRRRAKQNEEREKGREREGDALGIMEDLIPEQTESKLTQHLLTDQTGNKVQKQISKETIQQNPFILSENSFRRDNRGKEVIRDEENEYKRNKGRERNRQMEMWVEKMGSKSEGRDRSRETDGSKSQFPPFMGLRTIQANNIIIIEKDKNGEEKMDWRNKEVEEEDKRMRMDLREFLACGGSVTEIRASEVLIIKPSVTDSKRQIEISGMPERGEHIERDGIWTSMRLTSRKVMQRAERVLNHRDRAKPEYSGRVSQLLSKFGEHPKSPMRSKSTDCFNRPGKNRDRYSTGDLFDQEDQSEEETDMSPICKGVPKRSFSFSERVVCQQENCEEKTNFRGIERTHSERVKSRITGEPSQSRVTRRWGRPKHDESMHEKRQKERKVDDKKNDSVCGKTLSVDGEEGFTLASVKSQEGVAFARRIPIKKDSSSEIEIKRAGEENKTHIEKRRDEKEVAAVEFKMEAEAESERRRNHDEVTVGASTQSHNANIPSVEDSPIDLSAEIRCQCVNTLSIDTIFQSCVREREEKVQSDRILKTYEFSYGDTGKISGEVRKQEQKENQDFPKRANEDIHCTSQLLRETLTLGRSKLYTQEGVTIPRTVFYGVEISAKRRLSLPAVDGQAERRGSWKAGRPLTRVESLKERIRQQEDERQKGRDDEKQEGKREAEGTAREQEETTSQSVRPFDVTQDVSVTKSSPQLPVPVSLSLSHSASTEREVGEIVLESDPCRRKAEGETERHVEENTQGTDGGQDNRESEDELLEEEYLPPSRSPSPTLSDSLDTMSRIYNLKPVGSRTAVCISERTADLPQHSGAQGKYNPIRKATSPDVLPETTKLWNHGDKSETTDSTGLQIVQRRLERLQLREQEAGCGSQIDRKPLEEPEARQTKRPDILREAPASLRFPQSQQKAPQQVRSFTINARPTESTKPPEQISPSSSSPCTASPSSTPSPPLFSIRSASGGPGKRGTTITITPRRPASSNSVPTAIPEAPKFTQTANKPTPVPNKETGKKRYPTAEEIEVIGGYQNLERSCLVKSRATPKAVKVCFDEAQLERVCEYPAEDCVLASLPCYPHPGGEEGWCGGGKEEEKEEEDEEEDESAAFVSRTAVNQTTGRARVLKVDESCKRVSK
ncbi:trichohyalin [Pseudorasbora parva]|uniref:trichohyalin n=1 Tax=Pseudorasbora parva TaxID=51549 RepID=UPI00351DBDC5